MSLACLFAMAENKIGTDGGKALARGLSTNATLRRLSLSREDMVDAEDEYILRPTN